MATSLDEANISREMNAGTAMELNSKERAVLAEAAQFFLYMQHKDGMVKGADLKRIISKICSTDSQQLFLDMLKERLKTLIGLEIVTVPSAQGNWLVAKDTLSFLEAAGDHPCNFITPKEKLKDGFLNAVLMYLYMAKSPSSASGVPEEDLWQFIRGLDESSFAGIDDPKSLVGANPGAEFVSQGWIQYKKTIQADGSEVVTYSWGPRSVTIDRMKLLKEFCKIDGSDPRQWKDHWKDAKESCRTAVVANDNSVSESEQGCSHR